MEKIKRYFKFIFLIVVISSCSITGYIREHSKISVQGGLNVGGITENTDLTVVPGAVPEQGVADAYSGATRTGANAGVHVNFPLKRNELEAGIDYMYNSQKFTYTDAGNQFSGRRDLSVSQLLLPVTYNFILFKKRLPNSELQLHLGYVGQINFVSVKSIGNIPPYTIKKWSNGGTAGVSVYPFKFKNGSKLGMFFDVYRGTSIYEDFYNQKDFEMPASSYMKYGLRYRFK